jgi:hypothetical protein
MQTFNGSFSDSNGTESIIFRNDGRTLRTRIRGCDFEGPNFDSLQPLSDAPGFTFAHGALCGCTMVADLPILLSAPEGIRHVIVLAKMTFGQPDVRGSLDSQTLLLSMEQSEFNLQSAGQSPHFEDELLSLNARLPAGFSLRACITCGLSDYSPAGSDLFGSLACFRGVKDKYRLVDSKTAIFALWPQITEHVQETHQCPEFEPRPKGRGYRG